MKKMLLLAISCLLVLSAVGATQDDPSITVTGDAVMRVPADRAYVILYSHETDNNAETAMNGSLKNIEKVMDTVKRKGSSKGKYVVVSSGISVVMAGAQADSGTEYLGAHCFRVDCPPDAEDIFALIDDAETEYVSVQSQSSVSGAFPFSPIIYAVEEYAEAEQVLEDKALADAKARAEKMAKKLGKNIGEIISVTTDLISASGRDLDLPTPYISKDLSGVMMRQSVTVSYQLLP